MENNLKEIKEFINQWKEKAIKYYHEAIEEYKKELKEIVDTYNFWDDEYKSRKLKLREKYNQIVRDLASGYSPKDREERLLKIIESEAASKEKILIARVNKKVGKILKAENLFIGVNGELNGTIQGENGKCYLETIYAGGYNVQCLHFRVLVKLIG